MITDPEIIGLATKLEHLAFEQIRQYYEESRDLTVLLSKDPTCVSIPYTKYEREYSYQLMYSVKDGCWRCECKNNFRTGMPCSHLVKVVRHFGGCIGYYINERWLHQKDAAPVKKASRVDLHRKRI